MIEKNIPFMIPDITQREIDSVVEVLKSGWLTTGPKVQRFQNELAKYCEADQGTAVNSATAAMELVLKVFNIKETDEVITTPYTYTATASVLLHRGIKPIFIDTQENSFEMDYEQLEKKISSKTKAIILVDFAGYPCDYDRVKNILKKIYREDIILLCDSAHSLGAKYKKKKIGSQCDFHAFSFHAVKNVTTGEGGALTFNNTERMPQNLADTFKITALHGQTKDAFTKIKSGAWEYDIITDGFKCNMTDMAAALGIVQLERYEEMLEKRKELCQSYTALLKNKEWAVLPKFKNEEGTESSYHLYCLRIQGFNELLRNELINRLAAEGISTNVHFKPLPMLTLYKELGYCYKDYPNAYAHYANEITLPLYSKLSIEESEFVAYKVIKHVDNLLSDK